MTQVTSGKITCCDWLLTWQDLSVMTVGIMMMPCEQKQTQNPKKMFKEFLCLKTKQNTEMSDEEHSEQ